jgi:glucose/arabinose dehydrogenase/PKD repeat protein
MVRLVTRSSLLVAALAIPASHAGAATATAGFQDSLVVGADAATGVLVPTSVAFHPLTGELWITEKGDGSAAGEARVRVLGADGLTRTALALPCVDSRGERGLLDIVFDPDTAGGVDALLFYTRRFDAAAGCGNPAEAGSANVVARFAENDRTLSGETTILQGPDLIATSELHNGGTVRFLPDGTLLVSMGDNALGTQLDLVSQDLSDLRGKMLRIRRDGSVPTDNPFVGVAGARPEIWALGLRNPFRFSVNPGTGAVLIGDVGETQWEEANLGIAGANYGWPCYEAQQTLVDCPPQPPGAFTFPVLSYHHGNLTPPVQGGSIVAGPVYTGSAFPPEYRGNWFFADYSRRWIRRAVLGPDGLPGQVEMFASLVPGPVDLEVGPDGCLTYAAIGSSEVRRICYVGGDNGQPTAVASMAPRSGQPPLEVFVDARGSSDPDGDPLAFTWSFGDGRVSARAQTSHIYSAPGIYEAGLLVDDLSGAANGTDRSPPLLVVVGNDAPQVELSLPAAESRYDAGQTISFGGAATDSQDGALPSPALSWTVVFHHGDHVHPFLGPIVGLTSGSFTIPAQGEPATDVAYELVMSATDSGAPLGAAARLTATARAWLRPNVATLTLEADPPVPGLTLDFDGRRLEAPHAHDSVVGWPRDLAVQVSQTVAGRPFTFESWTDGGAAAHSVVTPPADTTYRARFSCPTLSVPPDLTVTEGLNGYITVSWPPSSDPCLEDRPFHPRYALYRSAVARPQVMPGAFPADPPFSLVAVTQGTSLTFQASGEMEYYLVVEIGRDGQMGPSGHY